MTTPAAHQIKGPPGLGERLFMVLVLLLSTGAFLTILQGAHDPDLGARTGTLLTNALWSGIYLVTFLLLKSRCGPSLVVFKRARLMLLLIAIALASVLWSDDPRITLVRCVALAGTTLLGLYLATRFHLKEQLAILGWTFGVAAVLSFLFAVAIPAYGVGTGDFEGNWLGIYPHKNLLGINMAIGFLVFLVLSRCQPNHRWLWRAVAGFCLALVALSGSASALLSCVAVLCAFLFVRVLASRRSMIAPLLLGITVVVSLFLLVVYFEPLTNVLGRDPSLTGRTALWYLVWAAILDRPFLGYGYYAFWRGYEGPSGDLWSAFGQELFYSHNGFLDVWLDLGLAGLATLTAGYLVYTGRALSFLRNRREAERFWPLLFLVLLLAANLAEGSFLRTNTAPWILYTGTVLFLSYEDHLGSCDLQKAVRRPSAVGG